MIELSYNGELYSYDNKTSTIVSTGSSIPITIHPYVDIQGAKLYYKQGDTEGLVDISNNTASIPGDYLVTGELQLAIKLASSELSNLFSISVTKINSSGTVTDDDIQFTMDNKKRLILVPGSQNLLAIQFDNNSEIITFKFPRYQEEVDLSTKIPYVNYKRPQTNELGKSICTIDKVEEDTIYFSWLVDEAVTQFEGTIKFQVEFADSDGYRWQSQIGELPILTSLYNTGLEPYEPGVLEQYLMLIEGMYTAYHMPSGGTAGQVLAKASNMDYDTEWVNAGGGATEIFWAVYDNTTNAEIDAAEAAGKVLLCRYNNRTYALGQNAGNYATFYSIDTDQNRCYYLSCGENDWDNGYFSIGTYKKPSGGIPKTDLASAVQTSLGKADTALQSVPSTYRTAAAQDTIDSGKIDKPSSPATGAFLVWNGSAWVAQTLATWSGGSY